MCVRLPRRLKKAIKKTLIASLNGSNRVIKNKKKAVSFLYKETLNYEMSEVMEEAGVYTESSNQAIKLGLGKQCSNDLNIKHVNNEYDFSTN